MFVFSAGAFGNPFHGVDKCISLLAITAAKDVAFQFGATASELGWRLLLWLVAKLATAHGHDLAVIDQMEDHLA
jgi:hypothetical protein